VEFSRFLIDRSGYERPGFSATYDRYRPRTPRELVDALTRYARRPRPDLVVDLGTGTGLSARAWTEAAKQVIGVEPNPAMLAEAERTTKEPNVSFRLAFAHATGLDNEAADIVTCSQSLHWMEPEPTFTEVARILRPGGIFAAYDYDWPPTIDPELDEAFDAYQGRRRAVREARGIQRGADKWLKHEHLARMRASGHFHLCREVLLHSIEEGDAERVVGFARSLGMPVADMQDEELERDLQIDELERVARSVLGDRVVPFLFSYRVRIGVVDG
jgi:ubiquinone/menaquinone biosynthesis C-methylase UbiE